MRRLGYILCLALLPLTISSRTYGNCEPVTVLINYELSYNDVTAQLRTLTYELENSIRNKGKPELTSEIVSQIEGILAKNSLTDTLLLSDANFLMGVYLLDNSRYNQAIDLFSVSARLRELMGIRDRRYSFCLSNMAVAWLKLGDYSRALDLGKKAMYEKRIVTGNDSSSLASNYLNLSSTYLELNDTERALNLAESGLALSREYPGMVTQANIADLYQVISLSLLRNSEFAKALVYSKEALRLYDQQIGVSTESKQLMLNTTSQLYRHLKQPQDAEKYLKQGLACINDKNLSDNYLLYSNYADFLAEYDRAEEGEKVLETGLENVKRVFGENSREYCTMLASNASFVAKATGDGQRAIAIYKKCFTYFETHPWDNALKSYILTDYAQTLIEQKQNIEGLEVLDEVLNPGENSFTDDLSHRDDETDPVYSQNTIKALSLKYKALNTLAEETGNEGYILQAVETGKKLIAMYDRLRLGMSEEESRNYLSADTREYYTGIICNYATLYRNNSDHSLLTEAFEYSERSKVAGFLASMRELNATRFSVPDDLGHLDTEIQKKIGLYREFITNEKEKARPDSQKIAIWEKVSFDLLRSRDSLVQIFENRYPAYYNLKFKTDITPLDKVKGVIGNDANLLSYVLTDNKLMIFVVNNRHTEIIISDVDSSFYIQLNRFRKMLSVLPGKTSVREPFNEYMDLAWQLYAVLLEPAEPYLKGNKIVISPDNILSYIPFETLITEKFHSDELLYRDAPFALKKYRFSYIYSVTLSSEIQKRSRRLKNDILAFAPSYDKMEISDSLIYLYPNLRGGISGLPYAKGEALDALRQCGGRAFVEDSATEQAYKANAANFDIIHLAMHTLVDDQHPAYSKMIFSMSPDASEDGFLNTYEVYSVPLDAMMVVLSSCNTGSGLLMTGEGILSLARGFLFAGSRSVIMSMWEVEDYSGSAVVKTFYRNIIKGQSKSSALRRARLNFLKDADQARSHPYYWATLVVYGDDSPLYYNKVRLYSALIVFLLAGSILAALVYRGPRS